MRILIVGMLLLLLGCRLDLEETPTLPTIPPPTETPQVGITFATLAPPTVAVVQITPSPLPSATPTPTPTPVVYAVQGGDTLWSIALLNRTLPETIEALNPGLRPANLQIGQQLVLPPQPTALASEADGTPIPLQIAVNSVQFYRAPLGGGWILGEIENRGAFSAENVRIQIGLLDEEGQSLGEIQTWSAAPLLPPSAKAPFSARIRSLGSEPASLNAAVVAGKTVTELGTRYADLTALDLMLQHDKTHITISTTISNSGVLTSSTFSLIATLYDAAGNVNGVVQRDVVQPLVAGASIPFSAEIIPLSPTTRNFSLLVYGRIVPSRSAVDNE